MTKFIVSKVLRKHFPNIALGGTLPILWQSKFEHLVYEASHVSNLTIIQGDGAIKSQKTTIATRERKEGSKGGIRERRGRAKNRHLRSSNKRRWYSWHERRVTSLCHPPPLPPFRETQTGCQLDEAGCRQSVEHSYSDFIKNAMIE